MARRLPRSVLEGPDRDGPDLFASAMGLAVRDCDGAADGPVGGSARRHTTSAAARAPSGGGGPDLGMVGLRLGCASCVSFGLRSKSEARLWCAIRRH